MNREVLWRRVSAFRSLAARILLTIAAVAATAWGCGWSWGTSPSVRFTYLTDRDMARLPPLPNSVNETNELEMEEGEDWYTYDERITKEIDEVWNRAADAEKEGNLDLARDLLREYLERTKIDGTYERRNSAFDRLDALTALNHGSTKSRVQGYLTARRLRDENKPESEVEETLKQIPSDLNLKDNVAYLRAAELYGLERFEDAAQAFNDIVRRYPRSEKREASMFMAALTTMKFSSSYTPTTGDEAYLHEDEPEKIHKVVIDRAWHDALSGFKRLIAEYPRGRYVNDAKGWVAYLMLRNDDRAAALVEYYRMLSDKHDETARLEAVSSLERVRHHATNEQLSRVEKELEDEPEVALVYAYHNMFNYSIAPGNASPPYEEVKDVNGKVDYETTRVVNEQRDKEWQKKRAATGRKIVERMLAFSKRLMDRYPSLSIGGGFATRAAQASLELNDNEAALKFAQRALQTRMNDEERVQALWAAAVAEHQLRRFKEAHKTLNTLLRDYPKSRLTTDARRTLAIISEDEGDLEGALEQYIALDYRLDIAYFVDVYLTIEQLEHFIQQHPDSPKNNELIYALGLRYLRANHWADARATFTRVRTTAAHDDIYRYNMCRTSIPAINCVDPKEPGHDAQWEFPDQKTTLTTDLVMRDVQTANDLEALEQNVAHAAGDEATAEALYQLASYQFESSSLLFYNPVAWDGGRYWNLSHLASESKFRSGNESQILFAYMQEHDTVARALKIYLEVAKRFPRTRAARDALYTAAVCHERLADYNPYWRDIYMVGLHAGERMVYYEDVKAAYPGYQLPRGTFAWEPSTRTVNGAAGWAPRPKPIPRPTRTRRWLTVAVIVVMIGLSVGFGTCILDKAIHRLRR